MQTLQQDIKNRSFRPVYLLCGEEAYLKRSYKNQMIDAITGGDTMNYNHFEGKGLDPNQLISLGDTMPFFSDKRLIVAEDSGFFKSGGEALAVYLPNVPETTCMIFVESEVDKRSKLYKAVTKYGYCAQMDRQKPAQLAQWAGKLLAKEGKKITAGTMERFLGKTGDDMDNLRWELEKLICYTLGRDVITDQDVEDICTTQVSNHIFDMIAAIAGRKTRRAMELYEDLLTLKEPPMRILYLIARQFNQILQVKELMSLGADRKAIASKLKLQPFVVGKITPQARAFTREQILSYVGLCADMEERVKTGRMQDRLAVELLITRDPADMAKEGSNEDGSKR